MPIVNMVYSQKGQDEVCNKEHHSMGLSLTDFLFWQAIAQFICIGIMILVAVWSMLMFGCCRDVEGGIVGTCFGIVPCYVALGCGALFITAWTIVGFVILVTDDIDCLHDGTSIGILTLINFILLFIHTGPCFVVSAKTVTQITPEDD
jgi:hypothetical protein